MEKDKNLYKHNTKVIEHFLHPQNIGVIENATNIATAGNSEDGDVIRLFLLIREGVIVNAKVKVFGCPVAIASADILAEMIKGKTITEALKVKNDDVSDALGGLPPQKLTCSAFAENLLRNALKEEK